MRGPFQVVMDRVPRAAVKLLPVEVFNSLCLFLPGRLIAHGLARFGATIGHDVIFTPPIVFHNFQARSSQPFGNLSIGDRTYFGRMVFMDLQDRIEIEDRVTVAMQVTMLTHTDVGASPLRHTILPSTSAPIRIRSGAYLAARATLLQGVEIGERAVVAAGSMVTRSVPAGAVYAGIPARPMPSRTRHAPDAASDSSRL